MIYKCAVSITYVCRIAGSRSRLPSRISCGGESHSLLHSRSLCWEGDLAARMNQQLPVSDRSAAALTAVV
jgi:hypothetical protein